MSQTTLRISARHLIKYWFNGRIYAIACKKPQLTLLHAPVPVPVMTDQTPPRFRQLPL